jgi:osmotically inducible lipoprotein OsmB
LRFVQLGLHFIWNINRLCPSNESMFNNAGNEMQITKALLVQRTRAAAIIATTAAAFGLAGCSTPPTKQQIGIGTGAVVGGVVGSSVTFGSTAGTAAGAAAGALIGNEIGKSMDKKR